MGVQPINKLDASTLSQENPSDGVTIWLGPDRGKLSGGSFARGSDEGVCRLVFVFSSGRNSISGTSNGGSEREKSLQQSRDSK